MRHFALFLSIFFCMIRNTLYGQNLEDELKRGLYQLTPDWIVVHQLDSGIIYTTKLRQAHSHYDKVTKILFDSIPNGKIQTSKKKRIWNGKYKDILNVKEGHSTILFDDDTSHIALNFRRNEIGYAVFTTRHPKGIQSYFDEIKKDTLDYFTYTFFNLEDINKLSKMKDFATVTEVDFQKIRELGQARKEFYSKLIKNMGGTSMHGYSEYYEILVKIIMDSGYNPLIFPWQYSDMLKKYKN